MKIKESESLEERLIRENAINNERSKDRYKIVILIGLLVVALLMYASRSSRLLTSLSGEGDPYHCEACKALNSACSKHIKFDRNKYLQDISLRYCSNYIPNSSDTDSKYSMYGYGYLYNNECDFCVDSNDECYGCKYTRLFINECIESLLNDTVYQSKLCGNCWNIGYAECSKCREMTAYELYSKLTKNKQ